MDNLSDFCNTLGKNLVHYPSFIRELLLERTSINFKNKRRGGSDSTSLPEERQKKIKIEIPQSTERGLDRKDLDSEDDDSEDVCGECFSPRLQITGLLGRGVNLVKRDRLYRVTLKNVMVEKAGSCHLWHRASLELENLSKR